MRVSCDIKVDVSIDIQVLVWRNIKGRVSSDITVHDSRNIKGQVSSNVQVHVSSDIKVHVSIISKCMYQAIFKCIFSFKLSRLSSRASTASTCKTSNPLNFPTNHTHKPVSQHRVVLSFHPTTHKHTCKLTRTQLHFTDMNRSVPETPSVSHAEKPQSADPLLLARHTQACTHTHMRMHTHTLQIRVAPSPSRLPFLSPRTPVLLFLFFECLNLLSWK